MIRKCSWGSIKNLYGIFQNLHPKIKFPIEHNFQEVTFLNNVIKNQNSQIITYINPKPTNTQHSLHFMNHYHKSCIKSTHYILALRICTIVTYKNFQQVRQRELCVTINKRR